MPGGGVRRKGRVVVQADREMRFWEHLEALRRVLLKGVAVVLLATVAGFMGARPLFSLLLRPARRLEPPVELVFAAPLDAFMAHLKAALLLGLVLALPVLLYLAWGFVAPALTRRERRAVAGTLVAGTLCFALGMVFGYGMLYAGLPYLAGFSIDGVRPLWSFREYLALCLQVLIGAGVAFELPVLLALLVRLELLSAVTLARARPYAAVAIFVAAAVLTPPDVLSQLLVAVPMLVWYEGSIWLARFQERRRSSAVDES